MKRLPKVFGHRGGRAKTPENTLAAFSAALKSGAHGIELDVQRCASGELVVIHDCELKRTTDGAGQVGKLSLSELKKLSAGKWFGKDFEQERIPTLLEVLDLVDGSAFVNIELKNSPVSYPGIEDDLLRVLEHCKFPDQLIISSFDHRLLKNVSDASDLQVAILAACTFFDIGSYASTLDAQFWHPSFDLLTVEAVEEAHEVGLQVNTWTLNEEDEWRAAIEMEVDGIITDDPEGLVSLLDQLALQNEAIC
jgi:glycerophosphoryl diester phosphodiesterase